jgi:replicative DNA helicase
MSLLLLFFSLTMIFLFICVAGTTLFLIFLRIGSFIGFQEIIKLDKAIDDREQNILRSAISLFVQFSIFIKPILSVITNENGNINLSSRKSTPYAPHAPPAPPAVKILEKFLLAAILINKNKAELEEINLSASDFYDSKYKTIYRAISDVVFLDEQEIDEALIISKLQEADSKTDWITEFAELIESTPPTFNLDGISEKIKKARVERQKLSLLSDRTNGKISDDEFLSNYNKVNDENEKEEKREQYSFSQHLTIEGGQKFIAGLPAGYISVAVGAGGIGKTYFALKLAYEAGKIGKKTLCWLTEDSKFNMKDRLHFLANVYKYDIPSTNAEIAYDNPEPILHTEYGVLKINRQAIKKYQKIFSGFDLIILDPLMNFFEGNNNDNTANRLFLNAMNDCISEDQALLFLHHTNKLVVLLPELQSINSKKLSYNEIQDRLTKIKGASAINETARFVLYIEANSLNENERILSIIKSNVGNTGKIIETVVLPSFPAEKETKHLGRPRGKKGKIDDDDEEDDSL